VVDIEALRDVRGHDGPDQREELVSQSRVPRKNKTGTKRPRRLPS
jgi:hypothetical protein